jgi:hypothetical protein
MAARAMTVREKRNSTAIIVASKIANPPVNI